MKLSGAYHLGRKAFIIMWLSKTAAFWAWQTLSITALAWWGIERTSYGAAGAKVGLIGIGVSVSLFGAASVWAWLTYKSWTISFGDSAFEIKFGVIDRRSVSVPYNRIQSVDVIQDLNERMFGAAHVLVSTAEEQQPGITRPDIPPVDTAFAESIRETLLANSRPVNSV